MTSVKVLIEERIGAYDMLLEPTDDGFYKIVSIKKRGKQNETRRLE